MRLLKSVMIQGFGAFIIVGMISVRSVQLRLVSNLTTFLTVSSLSDPKRILEQF